MLDRETRKIRTYIRAYNRRNAPWYTLELTDDTAGHYVARFTDCCFNTVFYPFRSLVDLDAWINREE